MGQVTSHDVDSYVRERVAQGAMDVPASGLDMFEVARMYLAFGGELPFPPTDSLEDRLRPMDDDRLKEEFSKFDYFRDGRLTLSSLRILLETRGVDEDAAEECIQAWITKLDRQNKGFVDFRNFKAYYATHYQGLQEKGIMHVMETATTAPIDHQRAGTDPATVDSGSRLANQGTAKPQISYEEKEQAIRRAFDMYDADGDGVISLNDLATTFARQGSRVSGADLKAWIRKRDLTGQGGVSYGDFRTAFAMK